MELGIQQAVRLARLKVSTKTRDPVGPSSMQIMPCNQFDEQLLINSTRIGLVGCQILPPKCTKFNFVLSCAGPRCAAPHDFFAIG